MRNVLWNERFRLYPADSTESPIMLLSALRIADTVFLTERKFDIILIINNVPKK